MYLILKNPVSVHDMVLCVLFYDLHFSNNIYGPRNRERILLPRKRLDLKYKERKTKKCSQPRGINVLLITVCTLDNATQLAFSRADQNQLWLKSVTNEEILHKGEREQGK